MKHKKLKYIGEISGITGAFIVASNTFLSPYGFLLFLISSLTWSFVAWRMREWSHMRMSIFFMFINILGIYRWLL
jgi:nicotinamide riboside transporter PnuC